MRITFPPARGHRSGTGRLSSTPLLLALTLPLIAASGPCMAQITPQPAAVSPAYDPLSSAIAQWKSLNQSDSYGFSSYASFMLAHPGWPGEASMRKTAERSIRPDTESASQIISFFRRFPPQSPSANLRYAEALTAQGQRDQARTAARQAWLTGTLSTDDEARLLGRFSDALSPPDHDARMDRLLWLRATPSAARQIAYTSPARRPLFEARLALLTKAPDAAIKSAAVDAQGRNDPGYLADRALWMRNGSNLIGARSLLAAPRRLSAPPLDAGKWLESLLVNARAAATDGQWSLAYDISRQVDDVYPPGTVVRDRPFDERDDYTSLVWLAGSTALNKLGRPDEAVRLFDLYANAARSAQTRSKGWYWAGRAAEAAGKESVARQHYAQAAEFVDQFHGQLASERLGRPLVKPSTTGTVEISRSQRDAFDRNELVRAVTLLGRQGNWQDQTRFVRTIATTATGPIDQALAAELGRRIGRQDLSLLVGKTARESNNPDYFTASFPTLAVPPEHNASWTMIHAITRQESQFDRQATSPVGAKGLMQLMPGTARETAPSAGVSYDYAMLVDPQTNIRLGSTYFSKMMSYYGGSYVLAVAAYNAGPGNVNKWLRANGDPRLPGVDVLQWIEAIPLSETRNYVQRVLENAVVYDLINPGRTAGRSATPLSAYLGKRQPG